MALEEGRTTIIAREVGSNKIAVIPLRVLENSIIEPMAETNRKSYSNAKSRWNCMVLWCAEAMVN